MAAILWQTRALQVGKVPMTHAQFWLLDKFVELAGHKSVDALKTASDLPKLGSTC